MASPAVVIVALRAQAATEVRKEVNKLDNLTTGKAVDALLNFETVALFNNQVLPWASPLARGLPILNPCTPNVQASACWGWSHSLRHVPVVCLLRSRSSLSSSIRECRAFGICSKGRRDLKPPVCCAAPKRYHIRMLPVF